MVMVLEIIIGLFTLAISGIYIIVGNKEFRDCDNKIVINSVSILYAIHCIILIMLGLILITGNTEYVIQTISNFITMEV